jgi:hypothetical protein
MTKFVISFFEMLEKTPADQSIIMATISEVERMTELK